MLAKFNDDNEGNKRKSGEVKSWCWQNYGYNVTTGIYSSIFKSQKQELKSWMKLIKNVGENFCQK